MPKKVEEYNKNEVKVKLTYKSPERKKNTKGFFSVITNNLRTCAWFQCAAHSLIYRLNRTSYSIEAFTRIAD